MCVCVRVRALPLLAAVASGGSSHLPGPELPLGHSVTRSRQVPLPTPVGSRLPPVPQPALQCPLWAPDPGPGLLSFISQPWPRAALPSPASSATPQGSDQTGRAVPPQLLPLSAPWHHAHLGSRSRSSPCTHPSSMTVIIQLQFAPLQNGHDQNEPRVLA